jgi:hypothetical protein
MKLFDDAVRAAGLLLLAAIPFAAAGTTGLSEERRALLDQLRDVQGLSEEQMARVEAVFSGSRFVSQGNPAVTVHPMTPSECRAGLDSKEIDYDNPRFEKICRAKYMAPLYQPETESPEDAAACIDQFEFPDVPCAYPVVWVRAREAALLCEAVGKRVCDAHEWEGACAGSLEEPDYRFDLAVGQSPENALRAMRSAHNRVEDQRKVWSYGPRYRTGVCAGTSFKTEGCEGGSWAHCGSNTFPAGAFPDCKSRLDVYDLNGNAAEHMNLPLSEEQMASRGTKVYGYTEMNGTWFIFDSYKAHEDACRWRAPFWHGTRVMDENSHHNYHLGFRCCKTLDDE